MCLRYIFVFHNLMAHVLHLQDILPHRIAEQDCHMPEFGFGLRLHNLQDIRHLPSQLTQPASLPNYHELRKVIYSSVLL